MRRGERETPNTFRPRVGFEVASSHPGVLTIAPPGEEGSPLRILLVEDSLEYAALVTEMLREGLGEIEALHCTALGPASEVLLERPIDLALVDLSLPDAHKLEALQVVQTAAPEVPVVVLTGSDDLALGVEAVQSGAQDYLVKRSVNVDLLARSLRYAIERKRSEVRLSEQALHDALTGLPHRVLLLDRLKVALVRGRRRGTSVAVLFMDLDRFKAVNDNLGHGAGDHLLREVAERLRHSVRPGDTVARFGGDEFVILCEELTAPGEAVRVAERALRALRAPVRLGGHEIAAGASIGVAYGSDQASSAGELIRHADAAIYRAKRRRTGIELFEPEMRLEATNDLELEHELRSGIAKGELILHYQPQVSLVAGQAVGAEALVRWRHPQRGELEPASFVPLAEECGLIVAMGTWVLEEACRQLAAWRAAGEVSMDFIVSVNISLRQLAGEDLEAVVRSALARAELPPENLCIEVTESHMGHEPAAVTGALRALKQLGVRIALDDFGTGYSSLSALSSYPLDIVKIDRSFVERVGEDGAAARMFAAVLGVARAAELQAVAEGIEGPLQLGLIKRLGCEFGQGFAFGGPVAAGDLPAIVEALGAGGQGPASSIQAA